MIGIIRRWREGAIGLLLIALALVSLRKEAAESHAQRLATELAASRSQIDREREAVRTMTQLAQARDAAHAARAERDQIRITQEVSNEYQRELAGLRRRHAALRVRAGAAAACPGGGGGAAVSGLPDAARGADGAAGEGGLPPRPVNSAAAADALAPDDALLASEQALRLKALQDWVAAQGQLAEIPPALPAQANGPAGGARQARTQ